jgi:hypothetical protein
MSFALLGDLNWLAVLVATFAYFALGGAWFAAKVFGDVWAKAMGWDFSDEKQPGPAMYIGPLVTCFIATVAVAMIAQASGADSFGDGVVLGLVAGIGISGAVLFVTGYFDMTKAKPIQWFGIAAGYHVVGLMIAAVIVSVWT